MLLPIRPVVMPADLHVQQNGKVAPCLMTPVMFKGVGHASLHHLAARAWNALVVAAYNDTKVSLTVTSAADAYRSFDQQVSVFLRRYRATYNPVTCTLDAPRVYQGKRWYKLRGVAPVASPGKSNHGWGLAVDSAIWNSAAGRPVSTVSNPTLWTWMVRNAPSFGWSWEGEPDTTKAGCETWHIRYVAGDAIPKRVLEVEAALGVKP